MKNVVYIVLLLLLGGCHGQKVQTVVEDRVESPSVQKVPLSEVLYADRLGLADSFLLVINRMSEPHFYVFDREDYSPKGKFGLTGNGPEEFVFPFFVNRIDSVTGYASVYDVNLASFRDICVSRLLSHQDSAVLSYVMPPSLIGSSVLVRDKNLYYGDMDGGEGLFFVYDASTDRNEWIPFPGSLLASEGGFTVMNANRITVHPSLGRGVSGMKYYNKLFLYDMGTRDMLKEVCIGEDAVSPMLDGQSISEDSRLCCTDIQSADRYIYVLMQDITEKEWEQPDGATSRVVVLDWDLDYVKTYRLPHYTRSILVDPSRHRIMYTAVDEGDVTALYYWEL